LAVRYILGRAGKGKSHQIFREIEQNLQNGGKQRLILLVPEQFTLQSERDLIQKLNLPGIMRVEVLSVSRLAVRVFNEVGGLTRTLLNEQGKNMVLRKIIDEVSSDLTIYKKAAQKDGFIEKFSKLLADLKQQDILPGQLYESIEDAGEEAIIKQKIRDIELLYKHFNNYLQGRYLDSEDRLNLLIEKIESSSILHDTRVWVDGFTTFSPQSLKILDKIISMACDTTISLSLDINIRARDHDLFDLSRRSWQKIREIARKHGLSEEIICVNSLEADAGKKTEILHLETELYAYPHRIYAGDVHNLEIFGADNINAEVEYAATQILSLIREKGCRWKDIAVVCHNMDSYGALFKRVFDEYGIPFFMDQKRDIMNNPVVQFVISSLEIVRRGYRYEDMFRCLKTGLSGLDDEEIEKLENTVLRYGIQGQTWLEEFKPDDSQAREQLQRAREIFVEPLQRLEKDLQGKKSIAAIIRANYRYLEEMEIQARLEDWIDRLHRQGRFELAQENAQIWKVILQLFDQMHEILGDQIVRMKDYLRILEAGFLSEEVGIIPTTIDQVLVGSIQRSKSHEIRALLVVGVNDGVIPSGKEEEGILSEDEKELLLARGLDLGFDRYKSFTEERFLIYTALTKPRDYLGLSFAGADLEGKALRPSLLIDRIKSIFSGLTVKTNLLRQHSDQMRQISNPDSTFKYLVENLRLYLDGNSIDDIWWDTFAWYNAREAWRERRESLLEALFHRNQTDYIGADNAHRLFPAPFHSTVSRLEQFVSCPFAHFVRYGLKPQERKIFSVQAPDVGELFHDGLQSLAIRLKQEGINWPQLQRADCERIMDSIMDELVPEHGHGVFASTHRYRYLTQRLKRIARRAAWILTEHLQRGDFIPLGYEVSFGPDGLFPAVEIELEDGERLYLVGRIDRVDLLDREDASYVKIIDYKSGYQDLSLSDIYHGLNLQLLVYLQAILAGNRQLQRKQLKPAGIFYFRIDDPLIETESKLIETVEKEIAKKLKLKGLVLEDVRLVRQMDHDLTGNSALLPVGINQNGSFARNSSVLADEKFMALIQHINILLKGIGREIMKGRIRIEPVSDSKRTACRFCSYRAVCQFDQSLQDNKYRKIRPLTDEEVISRIGMEKEAATVAGVDGGTARSYRGPQQ